MAITERMDERNAAMVADRRAGLTYKLLAERYGVSAGRARDIICGADRVQRKREKYIDIIRDLEAGEPHSEIAAKHGYSEKGFRVAYRLLCKGGVMSLSAIYRGELEDELRPIVAEWEGLLFRDGDPRHPMAPPNEKMTCLTHSGKERTYPNVDERSFLFWRRDHNPTGVNYAAPLV